MKLSLIVRSFNDEGCIRRTLEMLRRQSREAELIVFDSGSTDGTLEIVRSFKPDRLVNGRAGDYLPGRVVNEAARIASGDVLVFNNSDCVPLDESWLEKLVRPLEESEGTVAAAFANQLPRPDAFALVRKDNERAFGDGSIAAKWKFFFSLASSAIPRKLLLERPFNPEFRYSEDVEWAHRMALEGRKLVYVPEARVEHSHNYTPAQLRTRFYNEGWADAAIFGGETGFFRSFLLPFLAETFRDFAYLARRGEAGTVVAGIRYRYLQRRSLYRGRRDNSKRETRVLCR